MDAGAAIGCFNVAELLWVLVVRLSCILAKTMRSFTCEFMTNKLGKPTRWLETGLKMSYTQML